jgi:Rps23 Pro-64 3,4-dihydroxylase Tpa1-like proline 4-hydroxylase
MHLDLPGTGFSAWINVEGEEVDVYQPEVSEDRKTVTGWIVSEVGKVRATH